MASKINPKWSLADYASLTFEKPDMDRFPNLRFAFDAMDAGGNIPCILNAANEIVVDAYLHDKCGFTQMSHIIEKSMEKVTFISNPTYEDYVMTDKEAREYAISMLYN